MVKPNELNNKQLKKQRNISIEQLRNSRQRNDDYLHMLLAVRHTLQSAYHTVNRGMSLSANGVNETRDEHKKTLRIVEYDIRALIAEAREFGRQLDAEYEKLMDDVDAVENNGRKFGSAYLERGGK